jgi:hypothetical protein
MRPQCSPSARRVGCKVQAATTRRVASPCPRRGAARGSGQRQAEPPAYTNRRLKAAKQGDRQRQHSAAGTDAVGLCAREVQGGARGHGHAVCRRLPDPHLSPMPLWARPSALMQHIHSISRTSRHSLVKRSVCLWWARKDTDVTKRRGRIYKLAESRACPLGCDGARLSARGGWETLEGAHLLLSSATPGSVLPSSSSLWGEGNVSHAGRRGW